VRRFNYRAARLFLNLPVVLTMGDSIRAGYCNEISVEGMSVAQAGPFPPGSSGSVCLNFEGVSVTMAVSVVRSDAACDAFRFVYESREQRDTLAMLLARFATPQSYVGPVTRAHVERPCLPALLSSN
jgi:hypothetical protein